MEGLRNRCIRLKISEYHLDLWTWLNSVQMCMPTGSRWMSNNYITRGHRRLGSVRDSLVVRGSSVPVAVGGSWEPTPDRGLGPSVTHSWAAQLEWGRSAAMVRGTLGQYVASVSVSNSPLTHNQHQPFRNPFENKVWEVYFYKEVSSFVHWSRHYASAYICMYMSIQYKWLLVVFLTRSYQIQIFLRQIYLVFRGNPN